MDFNLNLSHLNKICTHVVKKQNENLLERFKTKLDHVFIFAGGAGAVRRGVGLHNN